MHKNSKMKIMWGKMCPCQGITLSVNVAFRQPSDWFKKDAYGFQAVAKVADKQTCDTLYITSLFCFVWKTSSKKMF